MSNTDMAGAATSLNSRRSTRGRDKIGTRDDDGEKKGLGKGKGKGEEYPPPALKSFPTMILSQEGDSLPIKSEGFEEVRFKNPQTQDEFLVSRELRREDPYSLQTMSSFAASWPTAQPNATHAYFGQVDFSLSFDEAMKKGKKNCDYSPLMNKLFVDINHVFPVVFELKDKKVASLPPGTIIRATPVFVEGEHRDLDVRVCPVHKIPNQPDHILRAKNKDCRLEVNEPGGAHSRYSLAFPFTGRRTTEHLQFLCYSSCHELKRRRLEVLFTLEVGDAVIGRNSVEVKICSYPVRDKAAEEARLKPNPKADAAAKKQMGRPKKTGKKTATTGEGESDGEEDGDEDLEDIIDEGGEGEHGFFFSFFFFSLFSVETEGFVFQHTTTCPWSPG